MDYEKVYEQLGIVVEKLPMSYNPDTYAKHTLGKYENIKGVSYTTTTSYREPIKSK